MLLSITGRHTPSGSATICSSSPVWASVCLPALLVDGERYHDLPLMAYRTGIFAWPPLARVLRMRHQGAVDVEPGGLLFQFALCCSLGVSFTGKAPVPQMPAFLLPGGLRFVQLPLYGLLGTLQRCLRVDDD